VAGYVGQHAGLHAVEELGVRLDDIAQRRGHGTDETIGHEDTKEGADQGGADQVAQDLRRLGDRAHGVNDTEHGGDDAERRQAIGHGVQGAGDGGFLVMMSLQVLVHQGLELVWVLAAHGQ